MDVDMQDKLKQAHEEFRMKVKSAFIQDIHNPDIMVKAEQTISEYQGSLLSEDEMLEILMKASRDQA